MSFENAYSLSKYDRDGDGIEDDLDKCPFAPETYNKFQDSDGCPDSVQTEKPKFEFPDTDGDGIEDRKDKCIYQPENYNNYLDSDGCPDIVPETSNTLDSDLDSIPDSVDACPFEKEVFNGFKDADGCPDSLTPEVNVSSENLSNSESQCLGSKIPASRINSNSIVCVDLNTIEKWEELGIGKRLNVAVSDNLAKENGNSNENKTSPVPIPKEPQLNLEATIEKIDPSFSNRPDTEKQNIKSIMTYYSALSPWNKKVLLDLLADDFIQHDPSMPGDKVGTIDQFDKKLSLLSTDELKISIKRIYADENFVIVHNSFHISNQVDSSVIDIFSFDKSGKIVEHWDVVQNIPKNSLNPNTMFYLD